ncbi:acyltransferase family protein [Terriglobus sp. ADX1]|uniref:acyltransferase family protein n=1 Tax=Terriglobus sp. ADX1 TaxID=2794063 RepID=UPI002FE5CE74
MEVALDTISQPVGIRQTRDHLLFLDGFRGIAALYVVLHHAYLQAWPVNSNLDLVLPGHLAGLMHWLVYGRYAVTAFLTVSGFSLMIPVLRYGTLRNGTLGFYLGRARRILPPYYVALLFAAAVVFVNAHFLHIGKPPSLRSIVTHGMLMQNFFGEALTINPPMWSIAVESQIYVLFPMFVFLWKKFGMAVVGVLSAALALLVVFLFGHSKFPASYMAVSFPASYLLVFCCGMFASTEAARPEAVRRLPMYRALLILCVVILAVWIHLKGFRTPWGIDLIAGFGTACALILASLKDGFLRRITSWKPFATVGAISYSMYLIHDPLQHLLAGSLSRAHLSPDAMFLLQALPMTAIILVISFWFYRLFERPFMASKPKV